MGLAALYLSWVVALERRVVMAETVSIDAHYKF